MPRKIVEKIVHSFAIWALCKIDRFGNNSKIYTLISKRLSVENKAKLSQLETQNTCSAVLFIYNFQLRETDWSCWASWFSSRVGIRALLVLLPLLGLTWLLGYLAIGAATQIMQALFAILNALQVSSTHFITQQNRLLMNPLPLITHRIHHQ